MTGTPRYKRVHRKARDWKELLPYLSDRLVSSYATGLVAVSEYTADTNGNVRERYVADALNALAEVHLGVDRAANSGAVLQLGCDAAIDFFFSEFWRAIDPRYEIFYDKTCALSRQDLSLRWYDPFHCGLIQCLIAKRWKDVVALADWAEYDLVRDYFVGKGSKAEQVADVYLLVASSLRSEPPMPGVEKVIARIEKCRDKWPRLLLEVWRAVEARDQAAFDAALVASLTQFTKEKNEESFSHWLALPETALVHTAMHFGMQMPELPDGLEDYVITRQSLGLDP